MAYHTRSTLFQDHTLPQLPPPYQHKIDESNDLSSYQRSKSLMPGKVTLFGRNELVNNVVNDITQTGKKCVVLEGAPGCGKTAVAIASCHDLIEKGITCNFVDFRSVQSSQEIMQAILSSLNCGDTVGHVSPNGKIFEVLQRTDEKRVFLFDNVEDCLESEELKDNFVEITKKISMVKNLKIIITSRVSIRIMQLPMQKHHMREISKEASISILTSKVPIHMLLAGELAYQCGYIPLALEVITALIEEHVKPEDILNSLKQGKAMKILSPDFLCNKEKLTSCISTSYDALDVRLRCGFISLAVFPRSFCVNAAAAVLGMTIEDTRCSVLNPLTRRCLLEFEETEDRWTFHVLLRSFALEVRKQDTAVEHIVACQTYIHRFCSFFIKFLQQVSQKFLPKTLDCIRQCQTDFFNILETLKLAKDPVLAPEFSCLTDGVTGGQFDDLLSCIVPVEDQLNFYQNCVAEAQGRGNLEREVILLCKLAAVYISSVNCTFMTLSDGPGEECLQRIVNILEQLDVANSIPLARCLAVLGHLETEILHFDKATEHLKKALTIQETNGDCMLAIASTLTELGNAEMSNSRLDEANYFLHKSHAILENYCKNLKSFTPCFQAFCSLADNKRGLGHFYLANNQLDDALKVFQEANDICQLYAPNHPTTRFATDGIALCYLRMRNFEKALQFYEKSLELRKKVVGVELPVNTKILSYVYFEMGKLEKSFELERGIMSMWERSMQSNMACMKFLRDESTKKFVFTVFYMLVKPDQRKEIETYIFHNPPTTREIRIREFAHAMWSSEKVVVMHLEPERYAATSTHLKIYYAENVVGEICALENNSESDWLEVMDNVKLLSNVKNSCLLIIRPMPPLGKQSLRLKHVCQHKVQSKKSEISQPSRANRSKFCTIL